MIDILEKIFASKCQGCSMLQGSMGQSSPCMYCKRGDLNSSRFETEDAFWDAYKAKVANGIIGKAFKEETWKN